MPGVNPPFDNIDGDNPPFYGTRIVDEIPLADFLPQLNTKTLFRLGWGLTGPNAADLAREVGEPRLQYWTAKLTAEPLLDPKLVYGYFPATTSGDTVTVNHQVTFTFPRQTREPHRCLADWVGDVLPLQLVTVGQAAADYAAELYAADKYRDYFEFNALAGALAEALADYWHDRIRAELGIPKAQGERFSLGYPACPDLADRRKIVELLQPERIGVELSEELQLHPEFSTEALIITDPRAIYFRA